jgi:hypothetical protein
MSKETRYRNIKIFNYGLYFTDIFNVFFSLIHLTDKHTCNEPPLDTDKFAKQGNKLIAVCSTLRPYFMDKVRGQS